MGKQVPFLPKHRIEQDAAALLVEFERAHQVSLKPPIPLEDIAEKHLQLRCDFDNLYELLDLESPASAEPDILGLLRFDDRQIFIHECLDPEEHPAMEGRYRFTLAHEVGHWRLHRTHFVQVAAQLSLFHNSSPPSVVCRSSQAKEFAEWQANVYAACLLMPETLITRAWRDLYGSLQPRVLAARSSAMQGGYMEITRVQRRFGGMVIQESDDEVLARIVRPLAERFLVSLTAMRIRLETLGLLHRELPQQQILQIDHSS